MIEHKYQPITNTMTLIKYAIINNTGHPLILDIPSLFFLSFSKGILKSVAIIFPSFDFKNSYLS